MKANNNRKFPRGTAMVEFVLIVPLLAALLGLTFYFGWRVKQKHQVLVADRTAAWQRIETGAWPSEAKLNDEVFEKSAKSVDLAQQHPISQTIDDLVNEAGTRGARPQELADELVRQRFPAGALASVSAEFQSNRALWEQAKLAGAIRHACGREGVTWRRDEVDPWNALRDLYYNDLDQSLQNMASPGDKMAAMLQGLYLAHW